MSTITTDTENYYLLSVRMAEFRHPTDGKVMVKDDELFWLGMDYHYNMGQWLCTRDLAYKFSSKKKAMYNFKDSIGKPWWCKPKLDTLQLIEVTRKVEVTERVVDTSEYQ